MFKPKKIVIKNVMSFVEQTYTFNQGVAERIVGENNTDEGQQSNGSGKSILLDAQSLALLGVPLRDGTNTKSMVRWGQEFMSVEFELYNKPHDIRLWIHRKIYNNTKSAELQIKVNGEIPKGLVVNGESVDVRIGNQYILDTLDISKEDLANFFLINKEKYTPFFRLGDSKTNQVIDRFSNSSLVNPVFARIETKIKDLTDALSEFELNKNKNQGAIEALQSQMQSDVVEQTRASNQAKLQQIENELQLFEKRQDEIESRIQLAQVEIDNLVIPQQPDLSQFTNLTDQKKVFQQQIAECNKTYSQAVQAIAKLDKLLADIIRCPECQHEFTLSSPNVDKASYLDKKTKIKAIGDNAATKMQSIEKALNDVVSQEQQLQSEIDKTRKAIQQAESQKKIYQQQIDQMEREMVQLSNSIEQAKSHKHRLINFDYSTLQANVQPQIDQYLESNKQIDQQIKQTNEELLKQREWLVVFTKFKTYLSNKAIAVIQHHCNENLEAMNSNISVKMEGFKVNRDGTIREKITSYAIKNGVTKMPYGQLSAGEKARVNIAAILSLQRLINMTSKYGGLDLCFLDEIIESVDSLGVDLIMKSLNQLGKTILAVTFASSNYQHPHITKVIKTDGVSVFN